MKWNSFVASAALVSVAFSFTVKVFAADDYPLRPVTLVVPWPAGGNTDAVWITLAWIAGMLIVFVPLAIWKFGKTV